MMKSLFYILVALIFLVSCTSNTIYKKPDDLIPVDQMVDVLVDIQIALGGRSGKNLNGTYGVDYMPLVFEKYNIDSAQFARSSYFYHTDIDSDNRILLKVRKRLNELNNENNKLIEEKEERENPSLGLNDSDNFILWSENYATNPWENKRVTIEKKKGSENESILKFNRLNATNTENGGWVKHNIALTEGTKYFVSTYLKKGTKSTVQVNIYDGTSDLYFTVDLNSASVINKKSIKEYNIESVDEDWYRISITFEARSTSNAGQIQIKFADRKLNSTDYFFFRGTTFEKIIEIEDKARVE